MLVSKGILLWHSGCLDEAICAFKKSLLVLVEDRWYRSFAALHGIAACYLLHEDLANALKYADLSLAAFKSETVSPLVEAAARWLRAEILLRRGSPEGIGELRAALDLRSKENVSKLDLALISLRLACAYQDHGKFEELGKLTTNIITLLGNIAAGNKLIQGALAELSSRLAGGELSREVLQGAYRTLLKAHPNAQNIAHLVRI